MDIEKTVKFEQKEIRWIFKILIGLGIICCLVIPFLLYRINENTKVKDNSVRWMVLNTGFKKMAEIENEYTINMYEILRPITRGGFSDYGYRKSMTDREKIAYTAKNFKLARAFKCGYYEVPSEHILESNLNPHKIHEIYNELGLGGFWYGTAIFYHLYAEKYMPSHLWRQVRFDLRRSKDLLKWENALSMSYIWKWVENQTYEGLELWLASSRRWGRFIYKHYKEGDNIFPIKFVIKLSTGEVKKYNPRKIHYVWNNMCAYFEAGNIIAAHELFTKFTKGTLKLEKAEMQYRTLKKGFKQLENKIDNYEKIELIRSEELKLMKKEFKKAGKILRQVGGIAKKQGWTKKALEDLKKMCKELYKKIFKKKKR